MSLAMERFIFLGQFFGVMGYEVNVILGCLCIRALWTRLQTIGRDASQRRPATLSVVSAIIFLILATLFVCAQIACAVIQYVDSRDPTALAASDSATALNELANASSVLAMTLADGLLLWRAFIIWNKSYRVLAFPCLLFVAVMATSVFFIYGVAHPDVAPFSEDLALINIIYGILLIADNVILTSLIVGRIVWIGRNTKSTLGAAAGRFNAVATIITESALPYTFTTTSFVIVYSQSVPASQALLPLVGQITILSPLLILWRVASGSALSGSSKQNHRDPRQTGHSLPLNSLRYTTVTETLTHVDGNTSHYKEGNETVKASNDLHDEPV